jgi:hypothetical protein
MRPSARFIDVPLRPILLALVAVMVGCLLPASATARDACVPEGAHVERDNGRAVVYVAGRIPKVYACLRSHPRRTALTSTDPYTWWSTQVAGGYAAVIISVCNSQGCAPSRLDVFNLRTGRRVTRSKFGESSFPLERLDALELRATGTAVFTGSSSSFETAWVWRVRRGARRRLLDHGQEVAALSLTRTSATTVAWRHGAETRTAKL